MCPSPQYAPPSPLETVSRIAPCRILLGADLGAVFSTQFKAQPPAIFLNGPASTTIDQLQPYDFCLRSSTQGSICDGGAWARDPLDGRLDNYIRICGSPPFLAPSSSGGAATPLPALTQICGLGSAPYKPGDYNLNFSVTNSLGLTSWVSRQLTVRAICPPGERVCLSQVRRGPRSYLGKNKLANCRKWQAL